MAGDQVLFPDRGTRLANASSLEVLRRLASARCRDAGDPALEDRFVVDHIGVLRGQGVLAAPLPRSAGGLGWGVSPVAASACLEALRLCGQASLALGRVFEGHINAIRLLHRHASPTLFGGVADDVHAGHLIGLWVTSFAEKVRVLPAGDGRVWLSGVLDVCSGAGMAGRAVIAGVDESGTERLVYVDAALAEIIAGRKLAMTGMVAARTAPMRVDGVVPSHAVFAGPGDYMAEPDFSAGAWRTSAVTLGGLEALVQEAIDQLKSRRRHTDPHQQARLGQMIMARETARLWMAQASRMAEAEAPDQAATVAFVNLARIAVEEQCLRVIPLVQRSLGIQAMQRGNPAEQLMRDLATYLRQPAGDEVLTSAAAWFVERPGS